jgi:hypothetical protein
MARDQSSGHQKHNDGTRKKKREAMNALGDCPGECSLEIHCVRHLATILMACKTDAYLKMPASVSAQGRR